ncbi:MAG: site-2 protease family protein [Candidatus Omnitrophica bacterium]|nr:site-2 protease family protein [Candidatus Omnitrophota bacterium]
MAYRLGDSTAKHSGRLTLNPLAHIDIFWTIILPLLLYISTSGFFVFGAAKPVPINYWSLKNPKRDLVWIGIAGPAANFLLALFLANIIKILPQSAAWGYLFKQLIVINVILGVFNLIPIPPMDGSRILSGMLPDVLAARYAQVERYGLLIIIALLWLGVFDRIIWPVVFVILRLLGI